MENGAKNSPSAKGLTRPRRLINWWIKWEDLNWPNSDVHEKIKRRAEAAAQAGVTTVILFGAHFRWDFLPYFTLLHDYIATVAEELHKYGIELYDRHSVNLVHRYDTREEMRHVMLHSGPHLPLSPSREVAASWEYRGKRLNDWRMLDVRTGEALYYPQYAAEGFCYNNPDFVQAYCDYAKRLVADTGIDGLACEDSVHYMHFNSCSCPHCRADFKRRTGIDLPSMENTEFWGNWENPHWNAWIDMRYDAGKRFFEALTPELPEDFPLITCGANSASYSATGKACDARVFAAGGSNYVHSEMSGNTPPYKQDPVTVNVPVPERLVNFSHHQAVARENGIRSFSTGYGFTEPSANIIWAVNKMLDADCLFSTLKSRLGLPDHILNTLPEESALIGKAFTFEREHPNLFGGRSLARVAVYYSGETRDHTFFGNLQKGYYKDYGATLRAFFEAGISANTVFSFPENAKEYAALVVPSAVKINAEEEKAMQRYIASGGKVIVTGPSALSVCPNGWKLPTRPVLADPADFFDGVANGVWHKYADWVSQTQIAPVDEPCVWREVENGLLFNPHRMSEGKITNTLIDTVRGYLGQMPLEVLSAKGYMITLFEKEDSIILHLLAADYDTDIDHKLDEMRFHRSRVNYVNKVEPVGVEQNVALRFGGEIEVYTPFDQKESKVERGDGTWRITLPEKTAYAILKCLK